MIGTIINAGTIIVGGTIGLMVHTKLPQKILDASFKVIGIFTLFVGLQMALKSDNYILIIFSLLVGTIIGTAIDIEKRLVAWSESISNKGTGNKKQIIETVITTFILYCMGSMSILGAIEDGLGNKPTLLIAKSILDGFSAIALSASLGIGVIISVVPLLLFQGSITLAAKEITYILNEQVIIDLSAVGGLLLVALAGNFLELKKINVTNMLPALVLSVAFGEIYYRYFI